MSKKYEKDCEGVPDSPVTPCLPLTPYRKLQRLAFVRAI